MGAGRSGGREEWRQGGVETVKCEGRKEWTSEEWGREEWKQRTDGIHVHVHTASISISPRSIIHGCGLEGFVSI